MCNCLCLLRFRQPPIVTRWVDVATAARARPARRPASLQLVGIERLFRLVVPCWTPRGTHPDDRPTALSRLKGGHATLCPSYPGTANRPDPGRLVQSLR